MDDLNLHLLLAVVAGIGFIVAPLALGWLVRPTIPTEEKLAAYECGEPAIGSAYVQFDLRFYVVALLFIIFDVEVAFFFPWGTVFGGATQLADPQVTGTTRTAISDRLFDVPAGTTSVETALSSVDALSLAWVSVIDIAVFFAVLLVGFAYVWKRGDLDWVKAMISQARENAAKAKTRPIAAPPEPAVAK